MRVTAIRLADQHFAGLRLAAEAERDGHIVVAGKVLAGLAVADRNVHIGRVAVGGANLLLNLLL